MLAAAALLAAACRDDGTPRRSPTPPLSPSPVAAATPLPAPELDWQDCGGGFDCATMSAPLDYADADAGTVDIALKRRPATDPGRRIGSLLVNPGGPGASGVELAEYAHLIFPDEVSERFDIVGFDPRGVGESTRVDCGDNFDAYFLLDPAPDDDAERQALIDGSRDYARACGERSGDLLHFVDTQSAARDMDLIRAALGEDTISYVGYSYGTYLGATYADLFPTRVRAFVLDAAVDPTLDFRTQIVQQAVSFERALEAFFADCAARATCPFSPDGDPGTAWDRLLAQVESAPLLAPRIDDGRPVGPAVVMIAAISALYDQETGWPALADALASATRDADGSELLLLFDEFVGRDGNGVYSNLFEANSAVNCLDTPVAGDLAVYDAIYEELKQSAPRLGVSSAYIALNCVFWPAQPSGVPGPLTAAGAPPIVVIGTTGDPATPYAWAQAMASQLVSGVLLTLRGEGHTAFGGRSHCIDDAVVQYLIDLQPPPPGTTCD